ncbi:MULTISPECIES: hypothetical protein [unclassified Aureimonas]|uniref:hypothetical protein n=1 Tax=unclassified Aureimonas TaxID=2615206 RepID=UPI0006FEFC8E|nr:MULTISPECIES: hypothetical protein [unclassified Aureimonas]KQT80950.1 hypothetical protein ASG54_05705 [Aureimonas sp. Leaf460]
MTIAYVLLYLNYGISGVVEIPQHFASIEECQATYDALRVRGGAAKAGWTPRLSGLPLGTCVPVMKKS